MSPSQGVVVSEPYGTLRSWWPVALVAVSVAAIGVGAVRVEAGETSPGNPHYIQRTHSEGGATGGTCSFEGMHAQVLSNERGTTIGTCWTHRVRIYFCPTDCFWSAWVATSGNAVVNREASISPSSEHQACRNVCSAVHSN